jgi:predicted phosphodiesterase
MLRKIIVLNFLLLFFFNQANSNVYLIGHAYGAHGEKNIPYNPLKNFLDKNETELLIFLGDMTENSDNFKKFDQTFKNLNKKYIRGNHDGNLFNKISWWKEYKNNEFHFINLDMDMDMNFDQDLLKKNNKIYLTHHVFFNQVFEKISPANYMQNPGPDIKNLDFGKNNYFVSGDCGAYKFGYSFLHAEFNNNFFICTGLGSGWANNVYDIINNEPVFFNENGTIIKHFCINSKKGKLADNLKICLPKYQVNSIYMVLKFYKNILFG